MDKKKIIIGCIVGLVIIYGAGVLLFSQKILPNTTLSGHDIDMISKSSLEKTVKETFEGNTISINDEVIADYQVKLADVGASIDSKQLAVEIDERQQPLKWPIQIFSDQDFDLTKYIQVDEGKLNGKLVTDKLIGKEGRKLPQNAVSTFSKEEGKYVIKNEVNGNILGDEFKTALATAIKNGDTEFDATKYYTKPAIVAEDLKTDVDTLNSRLSREATVTFGKNVVKVSKQDLASFIFIDDEGKIDVDNKKLYNYLFKLTKKYKSVATVNGKRVVTTYDIDPAYYKMETDLLSDDAKTVEGTAKVLTFNQASGQKSVPTSDTYIEVSISKQYMWLYNDGKLVVSTPVVTGNMSKGWDTPTGTFSVWNKETDKVLDGATVGYDYTLPVNYWMAIDYTGVGIHDNNWLTSSNAEASRSQNSTLGSHGCINTPSDLMATVYNNTPLGTPVYVMK